MHGPAGPAICPSPSPCETDTSVSSTHGIGMCTLFTAGLYTARPRPAMQQPIQDSTVCMHTHVQYRGSVQECNMHRWGTTTMMMELCSLGTHIFRERQFFFLRENPDRQMGSGAWPPHPHARPAGHGPALARSPSSIILYRGPSFDTMGA